MIELAPYNIIVIVSTIPGGFLKEDHSFIEFLRHIFPRKPVVLYSTAYLPTRGSSYRTIKEKSAKNFGMERYDYYFSASVVSEVPMPDGQNPVSIVGVNLEDGSLRADTKREFLALLDFERTN